MPRRSVTATGMPFMDDHYKVRMGDFCVITGVPGHGKSTFVNDLTCRLAQSYGWRIAIASFEQHPQSDHRRNLRGWYLGGPAEVFSAEEIAEADRWIDEFFVFIVPSDDDLANLEWTLDASASAVVRYGVRLIVIDPWNELDHDRPADMSLTEYTGKAIKEFKRLAQGHDVHVIVVAHPTKLQQGQQPGLYSISDSAHWANKPDIGIVVWKGQMDQDFAEIRVVKSRYHDQIGRPGTVQTRYNTVTRRFEYSPFIPSENTPG
jgi:twinkle protein